MRRKTIDYISREMAQEGYSLLSTEYKNNRTPLTAICPKGHVVTVRWNSFRYGSRCPVCAGKTVTSRNRLSTTHPELLKEWDYEKNGTLRPENISYGNHTRVWWVCGKCGGVWNCSVYSKTYRKNGNNSCPFCSGKKPTSKNNLLVNNPILSKEWDIERNGSLRPENVTPYSHKKVWWKCDVCGYSWRAQVSNRNSQNQKCPSCQPGTSIVTYRNSLYTNFPILAEEWDIELNKPLSPEEVSYWDKRKAWWRCRYCGRVWQAIICSRAKGRGHGHGCRNCSAGPVSVDSQRWLDNKGVYNREVRLVVEGNTYIVDGFDIATNTIYEFFGDYWHGNSSKYPQDMKHPVSKKTFGELYKETQDRIKTFQKAGYNLVYIWESDWYELKRNLKKTETSK